MRGAATVGLLILLAACGNKEAVDPHACGSPAYDCLGGACVAGVCQPVLLAQSTGVSAVAVDEARVYWIPTFTGTIDWAAKDGSAQGVLASVPECAAQLWPMLAVDASFVYAVCGLELFAIAKDGTATTTLLDAGATAVAVSPSGEVVVAANGVIESWPPDGGAPLAHGVANYNLVADDAGAYWSDFYPYPFMFDVPCKDQSSIYALRDGSVTSSAGRPAPLGMMSNGDALVWTDMCAGTVNVLDRTGATTAVASGLGQTPSTGWFSSGPFAATGALAADRSAAYVFVTTRRPPWSLVRVSLDGGAPKDLGADTTQPSNVAIDDVAVYFGSGDADGGVYRLAKPR